MEKINWFPGHMKKSLNMIEREVENVDILIYVLDGRAPLACLNPEFVKIIGNKPILFVISKTDLSDLKKLEDIEKKLNWQNSKILKLNSTVSGQKKLIVSQIKQLCKPLISKFEKKGITSFIRAMVIGVPNSGKSTFINSLCGIYKVQTGNKPGVTKTKQWIKLSDNIELLDTPGTLWPNFNEQKVGAFLAFIGSIKDEVVPVLELSLLLIEELAGEYPLLIGKRYNIETQGKNALEILEEIGLSRKFLLRGGEIDHERTARAILDDFRKGRIGRITLI